MKKLTTLFLLLLTMLFISQPVRAEGTKIWQTDATRNSFTVEWEPMDCDSYRVGRTGAGIPFWDEIIDTADTSYSYIDPHHDGTVYQVNVAPVKDGVVLDDKEIKILVRTIPDKPGQPFVNSWDMRKNILTVSIGAPLNSGTNYDIIYYNSKGKKVYKASGKYGKSILTKFKKAKDKMYYVKYRTYIVIQGKKLYSEWSKKYKFLKAATVKRNFKIKIKGKYKEITINWEKTPKAEGYIIYAQRNSLQHNTYTKVAKVKANKNSYTIKKIDGKKLRKSDFVSFYVLPYCDGYPACRSITYAINADGKELFEL